MAHQTNIIDQPILLSFQYNAIRNREKERNRRRIGKERALECVCVCKPNMVVDRSFGHDNEWPRTAYIQNGHDRKMPQLSKDIYIIWKYSFSSIIYRITESVRTNIFQPFHWIPQFALITIAYINIAVNNCPNASAMDFDEKMINNTTHEIGIEWKLFWYHAKRTTFNIHTTCLFVYTHSYA